MADQDIPQHKIARAGRFLRTGLSMGSTYVGQTVSKALGQTTDEERQMKVATEMMRGFVKLRGTALKIGQLLSMNPDLLPEGMKDILAQSQHSVPPMSGPLAVKVFSSTLGQAPDKVFDRFNPQAVRAASLGQVHEAWLDGKRLAVKIQYPGVADSVHTDVQMAKTMARNVMRVMPRRLLNIHPDELDPFLEEFEQRLMEETDYSIELKNSLHFAEKCAHIEGIVFPRYYPEFSSKRVLTMDWVEGLHLQDFLATQPSTEVLTLAAQHIWNYYEFQLHKLQCLNTDTHPGNFLFRPDGSVGVLDFGSTKQIPPDLYADFVRLTQPGFFDNEAEAKEVFRRMKVLLPGDSVETEAEVYALFRHLLQRISQPYHDRRFNYSNEEWYRDLMETGMKVKELREMRGTSDLMFINRTFFGLHALFRFLNVEIDTHPQYYDWL